MLEVEIGVDDLPELIFVRNVNNALLSLSLPQLENSKDFFFFCFDLFCKGLIYLFGHGQNSVCLQELKVDDFVKINQKLRLAGIDVILETAPPDVDVQKNELFVNLKELKEAEDNMPLENYKFIMKCVDFTYTIYFKLFHNMVGDCHERRLR